ncbi:MAG: hypothetical protein IPK26_04245 [Planctomycetes bacterium]|nr:hypothetical protein [Planctomycetota bacterium]
MTQAERLCREVALARTDFHEQHGRWPTAAEVAAPPADPWGKPLALQIDTTHVNVRCDGRDGQPGTGDDIVERRSPRRRTSS